MHTQSENEKEKKNHQLTWCLFIFNVVNITKFARYCIPVETVICCYGRRLGIQQKPYLYSCFRRNK